ncbi:zinc ribbon domain-containing protein [Haloterrigena sp. SYSU A121-1]|uniref:Zinc ribbon domain-containing protein n=1 Tax=Haloterrigena gelatinilytica TaxID=2741724 RepID=A0A8J8GN01_9EURY|nr:zinc ribbon domain-containing protein [Haloterrigena gelatinilytica]NUB93098.1 zinc ribbon domain-containing protein [Haloterrigena gelatinilytica]
MSKITFRADDDLVDELEALEISKSEAMREALRSYLGADGRSERDGAANEASTGAIDDLIRRRVDERIDERLRELDRGARTRDRRGPNEVSVTVSLADDVRDGRPEAAGDRARSVTHQSDDPVENTAPASTDEQSAVDDDGPVQCGQCGEPVADDHVFCPNCGEKASRRLFCECGDEVRSDWSFCPGCGRRTPAADVLGRDTPS